MSKCDLGLSKKSESQTKKDLNKSQDDGLSNFQIIRSSKTFL